MSIHFAKPLGCRPKSRGASPARAPDLPVLAPRDLKHAKAKRPPKYEESMPMEGMVWDARVSTPGPPTTRNFKVATYNAGIDSDEHFSATHDAAIQTLADRLTILLGDCHVVCINH